MTAATAAGQPRGRVSAAGLAADRPGRAGHRGADRIGRPARRRDPQPVRRVHQRSSSSSVSGCPGARPTERYPYGLDRAEDLAGIGIAAVIWISAAFAAAESIRKLLDHGPHTTSGWAWPGPSWASSATRWWPATSSVTGRRIKSATLIADARHSWLDALSSAGAWPGLIAVAAGQRWGDPVAGLAVTVFICHVGYEVTADVSAAWPTASTPPSSPPAEAAAGSVPGVIHAHARARWTGRALRVEIQAGSTPT